MVTACINLCLPFWICALFLLTSNQPFLPTVLLVQDRVPASWKYMLQFCHFERSRIQNLSQGAYLLPKLILLAILSFNSFSWCDVKRPDKSWVLRSIKCSINFSNCANLVSSRLTNKRWRISSHSNKTEHISSAIGSAADAKLLRSLGNVFWKLKARTGQWAPLFYTARRLNQLLHLGKKTRLALFNWMGHAITKQQKLLCLWHQQETRL